MVWMVSQLVTLIVDENLMCLFDFDCMVNFNLPFSQLDCYVVFLYMICHIIECQRPSLQYHMNRATWALETKPLLLLLGYGHIATVKPLSLLFMLTV
jgi:hypothetical protein